MNIKLLADNIRIEPAKLPVNSLIIGSRQREIDREHVEKIKQSLTELGQQHLIEPIVVRGEDNTVLDGAHRTTAARENGWETIDCVIWWNLTDEQAKLIEAEANMIRLELSPLQIEQAWREVYEPIRRKALAQAEHARKETARLLEAAKQAQEDARINSKPPHESSGTPPHETSGTPPHETSGTPPQNSSGALDSTEFAKKMTGLGLDAITKIGQIREIAANQNAPEELRTLAQKSVEKLKKPGTKVDPVYKTLNSYAERLSQSAADSKSENRKQETLRDQIVLRTDSLHRQIATNVSAEMFNTIGENCLEAVENALINTLKHITHTKARHQNIESSEAINRIIEKLWAAKEE